MNTHSTDQAPDDGGPAFPRPASTDPEYGGRMASQTGMSLRDYFAGKALQGIEASQGNSGHFVSTAEKVADRAYELANAMLKARTK